MVRLVNGDKRMRHPKNYGSEAGAMKAQRRTERKARKARNKNR